MGTMNMLFDAWICILCTSQLLQHVGGWLLLVEPFSAGPVRLIAMGPHEHFVITL